MKTLALDPAVDTVIALHRGLCPALALGVQISRLALEEVGSNDRDHEVIAVAEGTTCALDAIQALTGCTFGNRDLKVIDHGKLAFTFWRRADGKGVRISVPAEAWTGWEPEHINLFARVQVDLASAQEVERFRELHQEQARRILGGDPHQLLVVTPVAGQAPPRPYAPRPNVTCRRCGDLVTPDCARAIGEHQFCIPCSAQVA